MNCRVECRWQSSAVAITLRPGTARRPIHMSGISVSGMLLIVALITPTIFSQPAPTTNISIPDGPLKVTIIAVQGIVQARTSADQKWEKASEGMELSEGAELRTGPRSAVKFMIGDDQVISLDRLGTIQILRANLESGKVFTDL